MKANAASPAMNLLNPNFCILFSARRRYAGGATFNQGNFHSVIFVILGFSPRGHALFIGVVARTVVWLSRMRCTSLSR